MYDEKRFGPVAGRATEPKGNGIRNRDNVTTNKPSRREQQALLGKLDRARDRVDANRTIIGWIIDLTARLKRAQIDFLYRDCHADHHDLKAEVERLRLCIRLAKDGRP